MRARIRWFLAAGVCWCCFANVALAAVNPTLRPEDTEEISNVFREMGVVQRRAMPKGGRLLLSTYGGFDFSDGPYTNYSLNINPGFALSDFLEIYLNAAPLFFVSPRSIVSLVGNEKLGDGTYLVISAARPTSQIGGEVLWAPAYGKDSLGMRTIIRSDTFFKLGASMVSYSGGQSGFRLVAGVGKSFFFSRHVGFRLCVNYTAAQNIVQNVKAVRSMAVLETGLVVYL